MSKLWTVVVFGFSISSAYAEPCPMFGLRPEVLHAQSTVTVDGGILVALLPRMTDSTKQPAFATWQVKGGKVAKLDMDKLAPGLFVVHPPLGAVSYSLADGGKIKATAKLATAKLAPLPAPELNLVVSGETTSKHVTRYVNATTSAPPKDATVLVLADAKGTALAWGQVTPGGTMVTVYSTQGGCVSEFPDGTVVAQPGDKVVAFWIDGAGRRSPSSAAVTVKKP